MSKTIEHLSLSILCIKTFMAANYFTGTNCIKRFILRNKLSIKQISAGGRSYNKCIVNNNLLVLSNLPTNHLNLLKNTYQTYCN